MKARYKILALLLALGASFGAGYYLTPTKVRTEERVVVKEVERKDVRRNVETEIRVIKRPDGTEETILRERDLSTESSVVNRDSDTSKTKIVERNESQWMATILTGVQRDDLSFDIGKGSTILLVQRRIIGPISVGAWASLNADFGVGITLQF